MLNSVLSSLKNLTGPELVANLNTKADLTKRRLNALGQKTSAELEKVAHELVSKFVTTNGEELTEEIKHEITAKLIELDASPKGLLSQLRYVNEVVATTAPKTIADVKNLRTTIAEKLVADAKKRIEEKNSIGKSAAEAAADEASVTSKH